jgi:hypothetical protein
LQRPCHAAPHVFAYSADAPAGRFLTLARDLAGN